MRKGGGGELSGAETRERINAEPLLPHGGSSPLAVLSVGHLLNITDNGRTYKTKKEGLGGVGARRSAWIKIALGNRTPPVPPPNTHNASTEV